MAKEKKMKKAGKGLWVEFKEFMNRGNAFMLAVGVVIGAAFGAIVSAFTNILLNAVMAAVPGGLGGLVTPIKTSTAIKMAEGCGLTADQLVISGVDYLALDAGTRGLYVAHGGNYYFSSMPILDWGALINAIISFIIVGLVLFIIVKAVNSAAKRKEALQAKAREEYYKKHPEERPAPVEEGAPAPTTEELLTQIRDLLAEKK